MCVWLLFVLFAVKYSSEITIKKKAIIRGNGYILGKPDPEPLSNESGPQKPSFSNTWRTSIKSFRLSL